MTRQNTYRLITLVTLNLALTACGGGSSSTGGGTGGEEPSINNKGIQTCPSMTTVTGKSIKKLTNDAKVHIVHQADGTREACVLQGKAEVE